MVQDGEYGTAVSGRQRHVLQDAYTGHRSAGDKLALKPLRAAGGRHLCLPRIGIQDGGCLSPKWRFEPQTGSSVRPLTASELPNPARALAYSCSRDPP